MIELPYNHPDITDRTVKRIDSGSLEHLPLIERKSGLDNILFVRLYSILKFLWNISGIKSESADRLKIFRRQMYKDLLNEFINIHSDISFLFVILSILMFFQQNFQLIYNFSYFSYSFVLIFTFINNILNTISKIKNIPQKIINFIF